MFLTVTSTKQAANPSETAAFGGTISNNLASGETLDAFSYFFDFNNFDASALSNPERSLPKGVIDFSIPNGTASSITELFSVTLLPGAIAGQSYPIDVTLEACDANGNTLLGNTVEVNVIDAKRSRRYRNGGLQRSASPCRGARKVWRRNLMLVAPA